MSILEDPETSKPLALAVDVERRPFENRLDAAQYVSGLVASAGLEAPEKDPGLWAWLALFYFDQLCPEGRKPGEIARWIPVVGDFRRCYRHLLAGPYRVYRPIEPRGGLDDGGVGHELLALGDLAVDAAHLMWRAAQ